MGHRGYNDNADSSGRPCSLSWGGWLVLGCTVALPVLLIAEGKRQERRYGKGSGRGRALFHVGMLEIQRLLEPERKVEILQLKEEERAFEQEPARH